MVIQSNCRNRAMNRKYRLFCCCSVARSWPFVCNPMYFTNRQSLLNTMFTESMMLSTQLICCCPFILPSIFPSMRSFPMGRLLYQVTKVMELHITFQRMELFNEYSGLISFRIYWLDILSVQGTLRSPPWYHNLKVPILWPSAFFMV